jgi:hypothetical protein
MQVLIQKVIHNLKMGLHRQRINHVTQEFRLKKCEI